MTTLLDARPTVQTDGLAQRARENANKSFDISGQRRTKMCLLPFQSPTQEPDGSVRLCSASSTFGYARETSLGNYQTEGLASVWKGEKYRHIRKTLLSGEQLEPYCSACEYRHDGEAWMLQLHLALFAYHTTQCRDPELLGMISRHSGRYAEYEMTAPQVGLSVYALPDGSQTNAPNTALPEVLITADKTPVYVDFNTLNRCNVSCIMCPPAVEHDDRGLKRGEYFRLSEQEFKRVCEGLNVKTAHFVGAYAEPLLNKDIFKLIRLAKDNGAMTAITTNASVLIPRFANRLLDAGLDMITVSLHGATKATAEKIMRKSSFERVVTNLLELKRLKAERQTPEPCLYFNFVSQRDNMHEIPDFIDLAADLGAHVVHIVHLIDGGLTDKAANPIYYPDVIGPACIEALARGKRHNLPVVISPAYAEIVSRYQADHSVTAL